MPTDHYDLVWARGEQSVTVFELRNADETPQDLTGKAFTFVVRRAAVDTGDPLLTLSTGVSSAAGSLEMTPLTGRLTLTIHPATTQLLNAALWALWADPADTDADLIIRGRVLPERAIRP